MSDSESGRLGPPIIECRSLSRRFGQVSALDSVTFSVARAECTCLIGQSGSGKTTALRCMNGLERATSGEVWVEGERIRPDNVRALRRQRQRIGYVIQEGGLFPHLTLFENVSLLGRINRHAMAQRRARTRELLDLVHLPFDRFGDRYPCQLSGGQRQRVGVARSLYMDPPIVLMDEPFSALDPITRLELQEEFSELNSQLHKTIVFVTHDMTEAFMLADRIVVLEAGRVVQWGTPEELSRDPANLHVARLVKTAKAGLSG